VSAKVLRGRSVRRLYRTVYVAADEPLTLALRIRAALRVLPAGTVVSGVTVLQLRGLDLGPSEPLRFLTVSPRQVRRPALRVTRVRTLPPNDGRCVTPEGAFITAAGTLDLVDLVAAGDWLVKRRLATPDSLVAMTAGVQLRGCANARRAASLVRRRVDSVRETRLRLLLVLAGLPEPDCNVPLGTKQWFIGTPDLVYQVFHVVVEYEGDQHRRKGQWTYDIGRYEDFTADGWTVIRVTSERMSSPIALVKRIYAALRAGGYDGPPPVFSDEWLTLFG
jgi:hypothetical protein